MASPKHTAVEAHEHDERRVNIPTADAESFVPDEVAAPTVTRWPRQTELDPQLVWRGKDAKQDVLDVVAPPIYIQEKIDPRALVENLRRTAQRPEEEPELTLFKEFDDLGPWEAVEYYKHSSKWANRMILGDSLNVMASLAERENLRGQVQAIYIDPPYGIKFQSNWQPRIDKRDVKDGNLADMAREAEQIKAFRDTWEDGIHTYLTYLRDRLLVARELLTESGSVFVQIGDENVHLVRSLLDEVFGSENFASLITFKTTSGAGSFAGGTNVLSSVNNYVLWYARNLAEVKYRPLFQRKSFTAEGTAYVNVEEPDGTRRRLTPEEQSGRTSVNGRVFRRDQTTSQTTRTGQTTVFPVVIPEGTFVPTKGGWKTNREGMERLKWANRLTGAKNTLYYVRYFDDFPLSASTNLWDDTTTAGFADPKTYVVQTNSKVIERCLLMTTDPGDLVLDPTCGSGTTAHVAEQRGRRWITIDTSRVAIALARQRLMGARFPYYLLADSPEGAAKERSLGAPPERRGGPHKRDLRQGFVYERTPHITLKSIANNPDIRPGMSRTEIEAAIRRHADVEYLYDRPYDDKKKVRVSGRFTVESLSPHRSVSFDATIPDGGRRDTEATDVLDVSAGYEETILDNLLTAGVQNGRRRERLMLLGVDPHPGRFVQATGTVAAQADVEAAKAHSSRAEPATQRVAIALGPEYGTVDARMVKAAAREALGMPDVDSLLVLGYAFEANALDALSETQREGFASVAAERRLGRLPILLVRMNVDLAMGDDLLKNSSTANLFTVFGEPDIDVRITDDGVVVEIMGVDVYDPTTGEVRSGGTDGIAMWMVDTDYDEESFFVRHAYFLGGQDPYKKLRTSLKADVDPEAWESLYRTESRPFPVPSTGKVAVKAINYYGDEVLVVREVSRVDAA
ncbi:site-specific DNA-methyltransferase [Georgenia satyanarayanai]|uniref:site-specific DNA-methyltransferase n=1 Tax=Georgenia satyanarayanai TaxID=860221 RepID=UPI002040F41C|nr:site-specific DNA-methyltransferase [Georgenia satyanarayanai]MCM3659419.1 site-specific DNA-methyltransferase [Georgenia satyanarayanai]